MKKITIGLLILTIIAFLITLIDQIRVLLRVISDNMFIFPGHIIYALGRIFILPFFGSIFFGIALWWFSLPVILILILILYFIFKKYNISKLYIIWIILLILYYSGVILEKSGLPLIGY